MNRRKVEYYVYKKTAGVWWPGECWDGPFTLAKARRAMKVIYCPANCRNCKSDGSDFRIVKNTLEVVE